MRLWHISWIPGFLWLVTEFMSNMDDWKFVKMLDCRFGKTFEEPFDYLNICYETLWWLCNCEKKLVAKSLLLPQSHLQYLYCILKVLSNLAQIILFLGCITHFTSFLSSYFVIDNWLNFLYFAPLLFRQHTEIYWFCGTSK